MGLILLGIGLFFWFGMGVALAIVGALITAAGAAGNIAEARSGQHGTISKPGRK